MITLQADFQVSIAVAVGITLMIISASKANASIYLLIGSTLVSIAILFVGMKVGSRARLEDIRYQSIRATSIYISTYFGTCFDRSNLTDANLEHALLANTNLTAANLTRTNLHGVIQLNSARLDRTILTDSLVRNLLVTHQTNDNNNYTVDLIFHHGIDWTSFSNAWQQIQIENDGTPLSICSIEHKGAGTIVVKVEVPLRLDKAQLHQDFDRY